LKIIVGLGNPGGRYEGTRHNVGFEAIDRMASVFKIALRHRIGRSIVGTGPIASQDSALVKPQTYMNKSGDAVLFLLSHYQEDPSQLVVVHDDLDLDFGRLRIKRAGGHGGHRGVESILAALATDRFTRIKIGIARPDVSAEDYVLAPLNAPQREAVGEVLEKIVGAVELLVQGKMEEAMNRYNQTEERET
jgi:peptidyl-tRNA hydrolase, PTH1 family